MDFSMEIILEEHQPEDKIDISKYQFPQQEFDEDVNKKIKTWKKENPKLFEMSNIQTNESFIRSSLNETPKYKKARKNSEIYYVLYYPLGLALPDLRGEPNSQTEFTRDELFECIKKLNEKKIDELTRQVSANPFNPSRDIFPHGIGIVEQYRNYEKDRDILINWRNDTYRDKINEGEKYLVPEGVSDWNPEKIQLPDKYKDEYDNPPEDPSTVVLNYGLSGYVKNLWLCLLDAKKPLNYDDISLHDKKEFKVPRNKIKNAKDELLNKGLIVLTPRKNDTGKMKIHSRFLVFLRNITK